MHDVVSIIIPTFNRTVSLYRAVASAMAQDYPCIEVIVVNDGGLAEHVDACLANFQGALTIIHLSVNRGVSAARNAGMRRSTGDYMLFLDDDDELYPHGVTLLLEQRQDVAPVIIGRSDLIGDEEDPHFRRLKRYNDQLYAQYHWSGVDCWAYFVHYMPAIHSILFRADILEQIQFDEDITYGEDRLLLLQLKQSGVVMEVVDALTGSYDYVAKQGSQRSGQYTKRARELLKDKKSVAYTHVLDAYSAIKSRNYWGFFNSGLQSFQSPYVVVKQFILFLRLLLSS